MAENNITPNSTGAQSKLGLTTVQVRSKRYAFPSVIVKTDADKEGVCVMLDVGLFCPFCAKSYKSKFSHKRSRLSITRSEKDKSTTKSAHAPAPCANKLSKPDLSALEKFTDVKTEEYGSKIDQTTDVQLTKDTDQKIKTNETESSSNTNNAQLNLVSRSKVVQLTSLSRFEDSQEVDSSSKSGEIDSNESRKDNFNGTSISSNDSQSPGQNTQSSLNSRHEYSVQVEKHVANINEHSKTDHETYVRTYNDNTNMDINGKDSSVHTVDLVDSIRVDTRVTQDNGSLSNTTNPYKVNMSTKGDRDSQSETTNKQDPDHALHMQTDVDQNNLNKTRRPVCINNTTYLEDSILESYEKTKQDRIYSVLKVNQSQESNNNSNEILNSNLNNITTETAIKQFESEDVRSVARVESDRANAPRESVSSSDEVTSEEECYKDIDEDTLRQIELKLIENLAKMEQEERASTQNTQPQTEQGETQSAFDKLQESIRSLETQEHSSKTTKSGIPTAKDIYEQAMAILGNSNDDAAVPKWSARCESPEVVLEQILDELSTETETYSADATLPRVFSVRAEKSFNQFEFESESEDAKSEGSVSQSSESVGELQSKSQDNIGELLSKSQESIGELQSKLQDSVVELQPNSHEITDELQSKTDTQTIRYPDDMVDRSRANTDATETTQTTDIAPSSVNDVLDEEFNSAHDLNQSFSGKNSSGSRSNNELSTSTSSIGTGSFSARSISKFSSLRGMKPKEADELFEKAFETAMDSIENINNDWTSDYESEAVDSALSTTQRSMDDDEFESIYIQNTDDFKSQKSAQKENSISSMDCNANSRSHSAVSSENSYSLSLGSRGSRGSSCDSSTGSYSFTDEDSSHTAEISAVPFEQIILHTQQMTENIHQESESHRETKTTDPIIRVSHVEKDAHKPKLPETLNLEQTHVEIKATDEVLFHPPMDVCAPLSPTLYPGGVALAKTQKITLMSSTDDLDQSTSSHADSAGDDLADQSFDQGEYDLCLNEVFVTKDDIFDPRLNQLAAETYLLKPVDALSSSPQSFERKKSIDELSESSTLSSIDEFIPEIEQENAPPEVMQKAYDAALEVAKIFQHHHMIHPCFHKILEESGHNHDDETLNDDENKDEPETLEVDTSTSVAEFEHDEVLTKDQTKQFLTHIFGAGHSEHKQKRSDLHTCIKEICASCSEKPEDGAVVKSEEITTQEVTLVFAWPKRKARPNQPIPLQPFRELNMRRIIRSNDVDVQVIEGPSLKTIEQSMGDTGAGIPLSPNTNVSLSSTTLTTPALSMSVAEASVSSKTNESSRSIEDSNPEKADDDKNEIGLENITADIDVKVTTTRFEPRETDEQTLTIATRQPEQEARAVHEITSNILHALSQQKVITHIDPQLEGEENAAAEKQLLSIASTNHIVSGDVITITSDRDHLKEEHNDTDKQSVDLSRADAAKTNVYSNEEEEEKTITTSVAQSTEEKTSSDTCALTQNQESAVSEQCGNYYSHCAVVRSELDIKTSETLIVDNSTEKDVKDSVPQKDINNETYTDISRVQNVLSLQSELVDNSISGVSDTQQSNVIATDNSLGDVTDEDPMSRLAMDVLEGGDFTTGGRSSSKSQFSVDNPHINLLPNPAHAAILSNNQPSSMRGEKISNQTALNQDGYFPTFDSPTDAPVQNNNNTRNAQDKFSSSKRLSDTDLSLKLQQINDDLDQMFPPTKMYSSLNDLGAKGNKARSKRLSLSETLLLSAEKQVRKATSEDEISNLIDSCATMMECSMRTSGTFVLSDSEMIKTDIPSYSDGDLRTAKLSPKRGAVILTSTPLDTIHEGLTNRVTTTSVCSSIVGASEAKKKPPPTKPKPRINSLPELYHSEQKTDVKSPPALKPKPQLFTKPLTSHENYKSPSPGNENVTSPVFNAPQEQHVKSGELSTELKPLIKLETQKEIVYTTTRDELNVITKPQQIKPLNKPIVPPRKGKAATQVRKETIITETAAKTANKHAEAPLSSVVQFNKPNALDQDSNSTHPSHQDRPNSSSQTVIVANVDENSGVPDSIRNASEPITSPHAASTSYDVTRQSSVEREHEEDIIALMNSLEYRYPAKSGGASADRSVNTKSETTLKSQKVMDSQTVTCFGYEVEVPKIRQIDTTKYFPTKSKYEPEKQYGSDVVKPPETSAQSMSLPSSKSLLQTSRNIFMRDQSKHDMQSRDNYDVHTSPIKTVSVDQRLQQVEITSNIGDCQYGKTANTREQMDVRKDVQSSFMADQSDYYTYDPDFHTYAKNLSDKIVQDSITTSILQESFETVLRDLEAEFDELQNQEKSPKEKSRTEEHKSSSLPLSSRNTSLITPEEKDLIKQTECTPTLTTQLKLTTLCSSMPKIDPAENFENPLWEKTQSNPEFSKLKKDIHIQDGDMPRVATDSTLVPSCFTSSEFYYSSDGTLVPYVASSVVSLSKQINEASAEDSKPKSESCSTLDELVQINSAILEPTQERRASDKTDESNEEDRNIMLKSHQQQIVASSVTEDRGEEIPAIFAHSETVTDEEIYSYQVESSCKTQLESSFTVSETAPYEVRVDAALDGDVSETDTSVASNTSSPFDDETVAYYTGKGISHPLMKQISSDSEGFTTDSEIDVTEYKTFVTDALIRGDMDGAEVAQYNRTPSMASSGEGTHCATSEFDDFRDTASEAETDELFVNIPHSGITSQEAKTIKLLKEETDKLTQSLLATLSPDLTHKEPVKPTIEKVFPPYNRDVPNILNLPHANTWSDVSHVHTNLVTSPANKNPSFSPTRSSAFSVRDDDYAKQSRLLLMKQAEGASGSVETNDNVTDPNVIVESIESQLPSGRKITPPLGDSQLPSQCTHAPRIAAFENKSTASLKQRAHAGLRRSFSLECPKISDTTASAYYVSHTFPSSSVISKDGSDMSQTLCSPAASSEEITSSRGYKIGQAKIRKLKTGSSVENTSCIESKSSKTGIEIGATKSMPASILVRRHSTGSINSGVYPVMGLKIKAKPPMVPRRPQKPNNVKETPV